MSLSRRNLLRSVAAAAIVPNFLIQSASADKMIVELDARLKIFWDENRVSPDIIWYSDFVSFTDSPIDLNCQVLT
jgi:hypothetical protein